jgi:EAL domain-containing protein (putative c-di-GMP-specific phosphodiesterase class I)
MVMHHAAAVLDTETQSEPSFVKEVGCHEAQGYFYSKPLPAPMLREWPDGAA